MTVVPLRAKPPASAYTDVLGRKWSVDKLDALIADAAVANTIMFGVGIGLDPDQTWFPARVLEWARCRYTREEPAALLLLLVTRFFDTEGAHYLGRGSVG